jgi:hypothetical protein
VGDFGPGNDNLHSAGNSDTEIDQMSRNNAAESVFMVNAGPVLHTTMREGRLPHDQGMQQGTDAGFPRNATFTVLTTSRTLTTPSQLESSGRSLQIPSIVTVPLVKLTGTGIPLEFMNIR